MATSARINGNTSHGLAVIAVRVLNDPPMTWVAAEVDPPAQADSLVLAPVLLSLTAPNLVFAPGRRPEPCPNKC
jgi:hypothetical protein